VQGLCRWLGQNHGAGRTEIRESQQRIVLSETTKPSVAARDAWYVAETAMATTSNRSRCALAIVVPVSTQAPRTRVHTHWHGARGAEEFRIRSDAWLFWSAGSFGPSEVNASRDVGRPVLQLIFLAARRRYPCGSIKRQPLPGLAGAPPTAKGLTMIDLDRAYSLAREQFAEWSVDTERAIERLDQIPLSLHCWQGDDVAGFEASGQPIGGGLAVTGNYPGRARNPGELRRDLQLALRLIPGPMRLNLHASYAESPATVPDRDQLTFDQFRNWVDWAGERALGLDFNPTYFAHPLAADGQTLSHSDAGIRRFWIDHGIACRRIAAAIGAARRSACVNNLWIPDGSKDLVIDRRAPRERLANSLDQIFAEPFPAEQLIDAVECKLFGLGSEAYVVGSHEFYLGYALSRRKWLCLDAGHFHPTESLADKISSVLQFADGLLLHVSRGVRWDSDHVVIASDELQAIGQELVRNSYLDRVRIGLDYFDASINRIAAWVIGARAVRKALLTALLEPTDCLREFESGGDFTSRLAMLEEARSLPVGAVWDYYCHRAGTPVGRDWLDEVRAYERTELVRRVAVDRDVPSETAELGFTFSRSGP